MAKAKKDTEAQLTAETLAGLRQALDDQPHLLQGAEGKNALFPTGKKGEKLAQRALEAGYLQESEPPARVKASKTQKFVTLTVAGREYIQHQDDPKRVLETLLPIVQQLASRVEAMATELAQNWTTQLTTMARALEQTNRTIQGVLQTERGETRPASLLDEETDEETSPPDDNEESGSPEEEGFTSMEEDNHDEEMPAPVPEDEALTTDRQGAIHSAKSTAGEERLHEPEQGYFADEEGQEHEEHAARAEERADERDREEDEHEHRAAAEGRREHANSQPHHHHRHE